MQGPEAVRDVGGVQLCRLASDSECTRSDVFFPLVEHCTYGTKLGSTVLRQAWWTSTAIIKALLDGSAGL